MNIMKFNERISLLEKSPIRLYLNKAPNDITIFEQEKDALGIIDNIVNSTKENLTTPLKVVVLGEVKAGKSTLVNSLIRKKVSYTNVVEATATILEINYAKDEKIIIFKNNNEEVLISSLEELNNIMDEKRENQEFFSEIKKVSVHTNTERLKEVALVDTPGLNTVTSENAERTENYIANADVILWVLSAHHLGQSDVLDKIEEVLDYGKPIICILNRIDEMKSDTSSLVGYVEREMGYMFVRVFAVSAKKAWEGFIEENEDKIKESNISELYEYMVNHVERKSEQVQMNSSLDTLKLQINRDLLIHKTTKQRLLGLMENINRDLSEFVSFNSNVKQILKNNLEEWISLKFFQQEKQFLILCENNKYFEERVKEYTDGAYIEKLIKSQYDEMCNYILDQWRNRTENFLRKQDSSNIIIPEISNSFQGIEDSSIQDVNDILDGVKKGGITASAVGLGLAGYAAWLGPAATYVSIGSAVSTVFPPLLIIGVLGGAAWTYVNRDKNKLDTKKYVEELTCNIKAQLRDNVMEHILNNLYNTSDCYYKQAYNMVLSVLHQCNTSKEEVEETIKELDKYITLLENQISNY